MICTENNTYFIHDFVVENLLLQSLQSIVMSTIEPTIGVFGLLLNASFVYMIWCSKKMHTNTNMYLVNLAISDSVYLAYTTWYCLSSYMSSPYKTDERFLRGDIGCVLSDFTEYTSYYSSLWLVALVTLERYLAICHPFTHRVVDTRKRANRLIGACWVLGITCGVTMSCYAGGELR